MKEGGKRRRAQRERRKQRQGEGGKRGVISWLESVEVEGGRGRGGEEIRGDNKLL